MARPLTQRELRNNSGEIMRALDRGESFIVTRNGVPVGELSPIKSRYFVRREDLLAAFAGAPRVDWRAMRAELDAFIDQDPTPRA
jgi:prevent-host-death family protein